MRSSVSTSSPPRMPPPGRRSCATWSSAASPACSSSSATTTEASWRRSTRLCPAPPGSAAARTSCATCSAACRGAHSPSSPRWCARSSRRPSAAQVAAQLARVVEQLEGRFPEVASMLRAPRRHHRVRRLAGRALAADLVEQPAGAPQPGDPQAQRRGRHLPGSRRGGAPDRHGARRAARRVGRLAALHERRVAGRGGTPLAETRAERGARRRRRQPAAGGGRRLEDINRGGAGSFVHHLTGRGPRACSSRGSGLCRLPPRLQRAQAAFSVLPRLLGIPSVAWPPQTVGAENLVMQPPRLIPFGAILDCDISRIYQRRPWSSK